MLTSDVVKWLDILLVVVLHLRQGQGLMSWSLENNCGRTIGRGSKAGELYFDTESLSSRRAADFDECIVTVDPDNLPNAFGQFSMFYFTEFELFSWCGDSNVTIKNGDGTYTVTTEFVNGLRSPMCGTNSTVLQRYQAFYPSSPGTFTVIFRWNSYARRYPSKFKIKFASYSNGDCDDNHMCSNGRCVGKEFGCNADIDSCAVDDTSCNESPPASTTIFDTIQKYLKDYWYIIALVIAVYLAHYFCKERLRKMCGSKRPQQEPTGEQAELDSVALSRSRSSSEWNAGDEENIGQTRDPYVLDMSQPEPEAAPKTPSETPPMYDSLLPQVNPNPSAPLPPPPSYDDVIANEHRYRTDHTNY